VSAGVTIAMLAGVAGLCSSLQSYLNGQLGADLGSPLLACCVNNGVGLATILAVAVPTGAAVRAARGLRDGRRPRAWHLAGGTAGALFVFATTLIAPRVGIALLTVAIVCGQSLGSLVFDRVGLSPSARRGFTAPRLLGVALAAAAVVVGAVGSRGDLRLGLLLLGVVAGVAFATQQITMGQIARATGEPLAAAFISVSMATIVVVGVALAVTGGVAPHGWSAPPGHWLGGMLGGIVALIGARAVGMLGALRLVLAIVAGQSVGALVLDLVAPVPGDQVTALTIGGVLLTFVAVAVSSSRTGATTPVDLSTFPASGPPRRG
jgi:transporter family-2 protein